jgi:hypothetical protein
MASNLQDILASARANAASLVPAPVATNANLPAVAQPQGKLLSFDDLGGSFSADVFLKVTDAGIKLGNNGKEYHKKLHVTMDTSAVQATMAIKASVQGGQAKYWRTHDGVVTIDGTPWVEALSEAQRTQPGARPYKSADIPMRLIEPVEGVDTHKVLGVSLSTTNFAGFDAFRKELVAKGVWGQEVIVELGFERRSKQGVRDWGVFTFKFVDLASALDVAAE